MIWDEFLPEFRAGRIRILVKNRGEMEEFLLALPKDLLFVNDEAPSDWLRRYPRQWDEFRVASLAHGDFRNDIGKMYSAAVNVGNDVYFSDIFKGHVYRVRIQKGGT